MTLQVMVFDHTVVGDPMDLSCWDPWSQESLLKTELSKIRKNKTNITTYKRSTREYIFKSHIYPEEIR
jgi:hypothetical protein